MKYFLLLFLLPLYSNAQKVEQYCTAVLKNKVFSRKVTMDVDYGEERKQQYSFVPLRNEAGNELVFNSSVDALNFLGRAGWKLVQITQVQEAVSITTNHYLFKREMNISELEKQPSSLLKN